MLEEFSQKTKEELKYYVYVLIDPRDSKIFYVGKGNENRVFSHINEAIENPRETEKLETIRTIKKEGKEVKSSNREFTPMNGHGGMREETGRGRSPFLLTASRGSAMLRRHLLTRRDCCSIRKDQ